MNLKVLLPFQIFAEKTGVSRIVAETHEGSFGLLPHRLDCVAALTPGILIYQTESGPEVFVAPGLVECRYGSPFRKLNVPFEYCGVIVPVPVPTPSGSSLYICT